MAGMDDRDLAILHEMFTDRVLRLGRADPRISAAQIGDRLDLATSTVSERIRAWRREGFLNGYIVFPNPALLGLKLIGHVLEPATLSAREKLVQLVSSSAINILHGNGGIHILDLDGTPSGAFAPWPG